MNEFANVYADQVRAESYAKLEFPGTYYLAYRDLPRIIQDNTQGTAAIDFGCGTGRSSRFLKRLGFNVTGIDISEAMIAHAQSVDPQGDYRLIQNDELAELSTARYDLVLSVFTFDNIPNFGSKVQYLSSLRRALKPGGRIVSLVSTPDIYVNEWASFSTKEFPENRSAKSGEEVKIVMLDVEDKRPVIDVVCSHEDYLSIFDRAGLQVIARYLPLGVSDEPFDWVSETTIAPWSIYVLGAKN